MILYELSPPQQNALKLMLDKGRALISLRMGMGKTLVTIIANRTQESRRWLIISPKNAQYSWKKEIKKWAPELLDEMTIIRGSKRKRVVEWRELWGKRDWIASCTYQGFISDYAHILKLNIDVIVCDESHRIRNRSTKGFKLLRTIKSKHLYLLTGTPISRGPQDFWTSLYLVNRKRFSSFWKFVDRYHDVHQGHFGMEIGVPQNAAELREILKPFVYAISREEADKYLPPLTRERIPIQMTTEQARIYKDLTEDKIAEIGDDILVTPNTLSQYTRWRQLLVCPRMLNPKLGVGAAIEAITERILDSPEEDRHCVIFTPFTKAIEHFEEYLRSKKLKYIISLRGGMDIEDISHNIAHFRRTKGIMICSTLFAESFELDPATICYTVGPVWDPNVHDQAEARLRRMTGHHPVMSYYLHHENTIEDHAMDVLSGKAVSIKMSMPVHTFLKGSGPS